MLTVSLLAWATSCGGLGCAVAADEREVPDVDYYVENPLYYHRVSEHIITMKTWDESRSPRSRPQIRGRNLDQNKSDIKGVPHCNQPITKHTVEGMFLVEWLPFRQHTNI